MDLNRDVSGDGSMEREKARARHKLDDKLFQIDSILHAKCNEMYEKVYREVELLKSRAIGQGELLLGEFMKQYPDKLDRGRSEPVEHGDAVLDGMFAILLIKKRK